VGVIASLAHAIKKFCCHFKAAGQFFFAGIAEFIEFFGEGGVAVFLLGALKWQTCTNNLFIF
jgi:hypothetical protein